MDQVTTRIIIPDDIDSEDSYLRGYIDGMTQILTAWQDSIEKFNEVF